MLMTLEYLQNYKCRNENEICGLREHWLLIELIALQIKQEPSHQQSVLTGVNGMCFLACSNLIFFSIVFFISLKTEIIYPVKTYGSFTCFIAHFFLVNAL